MHCPAKHHSLLLLAALALLGCGSGEETTPSAGAGPDPGEEVPYGRLSAYRFFEAPMADLQPKPGVVPYQVAAPLWADHAGKARFIVLPSEGRVQVSGDEDWAFPEGTIVIKNFFYTRDRRDPESTAALVETRLLIRGPTEWKGHTYIWNEDQTEALRKVSGKRVQLNFIDESGAERSQEYIVPNTNQCKDCHEIDDHNGLLGVVTRQLGRQVNRGGATVDQLQWLADQGLFTGDAPTPLAAGLVDPFGEESLERRARSYLDSNCGHCHRAGGNGGRSGLVLLASETDPRTYGVCKGPIAAGAGSGDRHHDIVPGQPERSILIYRMESTDPEIKMPEIPNRLPHADGVELISDWIRALDEPPCQ